MRDLFQMLQPWHLVVFAVVGFLIFGAIGVIEGRGRDSGRGGDR